MSENLIIRAVEPEDAVAIFRIARGSAVQHGTLQMPHPSRSSWQERLATTSDRSFRLVAELDGEVIGMAAVHIDSPHRRRHVGQIGMMVHDDYQGRGVGKALLESLLDLSDNWLNLHRLELDVYTDNAAGVHLYESHGFVIEGTRKDFAFRDGSYIDAYAMGRLREP